MRALTKKRVAWVLGAAGLFIGASLLGGCDAVLGLGSLKDGPAPDASTAEEAGISVQDATFADADAGTDSGGMTWDDSGQGSAVDGGPDSGVDSGDGAPGMGSDGGGDTGLDLVCVIDGSLYASGAPNPTNTICQTCEPTESTSTWTATKDGTVCAMGEVCSSGTCQTGCVIAGTYYPANTANQNNQCQACQPATSTSEWTTLGDNSACGNGQICVSGQCGTQCDIDGGVFPTGTVNPNSPCQSCQPGTTTSDWTTLALGTMCGTGTGDVCNGTTCAPGCFIGGTVYPAGLNPSNSCQTCQPGTSGWTTVQLGTGCDANGVCSGTQCEQGCFIDGTVYAAGPNPKNPCQTCQSGMTTWTTVSLGSACGTAVGDVCNGTTCEPGCFIDGTVYTSGQVNPGNACQVCAPQTSGWTNGQNGGSCTLGDGGTGVCNSGTCDPCTSGTDCTRAGSCAKQTISCASGAAVCSPDGNEPIGTPCGTAVATTGVCDNNGNCQSECYIGGSLVASGASSPPATNPTTTCQSCQPGTTTSTWTSDPNGTKCGTSTEECSGGSCQASCTIDGGTYYSGENLPTSKSPNACYVCSPTKSGTAWTFACGSNQTCSCILGNCGCIAKEP